MKPFPVIASVLMVAAGAAGCAGTSTTGNQNLNQAAIYNTQLAIDALQKNNLAEAKAKIDRAVEQDARNADVQSAAGLIYDRLGEDRQADSHFSRAVSLAPQNPAVLNNYAVFLCRKGNAARGEKLFLEAAANPVYRTPDAAYVNAGTCARSAGNAEQAQQHFRRALELRPRNPDALLQLAELEFEAGNYLPARAFLERFMEAAPATPTALWIGVRVERAMNNPAGAETYGNRLKNQFPTANETRSLLDLERSQTR